MHHFKSLSGSKNVNSHIQIHFAALTVTLFKMLWNKSVLKNFFLAFTKKWCGYAISATLIKLIQTYIIAIFCSRSRNVNKKKFNFEFSKNVIMWSIRQSDEGQKQFKNVSTGVFCIDIMQIWFNMRLSVNVLCPPRGDSLQFVSMWGAEALTCLRL